LISGGLEAIDLGNENVERNEVRRVAAVVIEPVEVDLNSEKRRLSD